MLRKKTGLKNNGFSLIELILYIGILAIVLLFLIIFLQENLILKAKINNRIEVMDNGQFALNRIAWYLHNAPGLNSPLQGISERLSLNMSNPEINPVEFFVKDSKIKIKLADNQPVALTNDLVKVNSLIFSNLGFSGEPAIIQVILELQSASSLGKNEPIILQTSVKMER
ncbi:MAG TPA: type II secretion system protein [Candidatus Uhrbacteria bacterium]|nr:type II secretion system protein [Candidatus Uhrbacteria bacterium]